MKTFVVLGMHRSATSLVGKGLAKSGVQIGENLLGACESNKYGHWEDVDFISFNDFLLKEAGGSWFNPPTLESILSLKEKHKDIIKSFLDNKKREPFWGWKDPRTCLTIDLFHDFLENPHYITIFRNPLEVAKSLNRRDGIDIQKGINLAKIYNERVLDFISRRQINE